MYNGMEIKNIIFATGSQDRTQLILYYRGNQRTLTDGDGGTRQLASGLSSYYTIATGLG
jgi:hypothetical protein